MYKTNTIITATTTININNNNNNNSNTFIKLLFTLHSTKTMRRTTKERKQKTNLWLNQQEEEKQNKNIRKWKSIT
jgi:hypothetical protein